MSSSPVIDIADLSLTFETNDGPVHALSNVSLGIERGDFVSLIGPSGCGKTTLLRVIADLEHPTGGRVSIHGMTPEEARLKRAYGYVFQAPALYPWRTIGKNIGLPLEIMGYSKDERVQRIRKGLDLVNLTGFENKFPWQLSGGMQQRASIARALSFDPELLLMDEPFGALDAQTRAKMQAHLLEIWRNIDITILFITHDLDEAIYLADRILVLKANPGGVEELIEVPVSRPRTTSQFASPEFLATKARLEALIHPAEPVVEIDPSENEVKPRMIRLVTVDDKVE